jgi:hypothetical protein
VLGGGSGHHHRWLMADPTVVAWLAALTEGLLPASLCDCWGPSNRLMKLLKFLPLPMQCMMLVQLGDGDILVILYQLELNKISCPDCSMPTFAWLPCCPSLSLRTSSCVQRVVVICLCRELECSVDLLACISSYLLTVFEAPSSFQGPARLFKTG